MAYSKKGQGNIEDKIWGLRSSYPICKEKVHLVLLLFEESQEFTRETQAETMFLSPGSSWAIVTEKLKRGRLSAQWVPTEL